MKVDVDSSLLNRLGPVISRPASPLQKEVDDCVGGLLRQSTDWRSLAALTAGGLAFRAGRLGFAGLEGLPFLRPLSMGGGLLAEVSAFEFTSRSLHTIAPVSRENSSDLWRWNGANGFAQGLLHSLIAFGALKGAGRLTRGENLIASHLLQDSALVLSHGVSAALGITPKAQESLTAQFFRAEAMVLHLSAGMALASRFLPGIYALERGMSLVWQTPLPPSAPRSDGPFLNVVAPRGAFAAEGLAFRPVEIWAMTKKEGEDGPETPRFPQEVATGEVLQAIRESLDSRFNGALEDFTRQEKWVKAYLMAAFARYAFAINYWSREGRDAPLKSLHLRRRGVERPLDRILNLAEAFAISNRELERIQFEHRRWGLELPDAVRNAQILFRRTSNDVDEAARVLQEDLLPLLGEPRLSDENYLKMMGIFQQWREKNLPWKIPALPPLKPSLRVVEAQGDSAEGPRREEGAGQAKVIALADRRREASAPVENADPLPLLSPERLQAALLSAGSEWGINKNTSEFGLQRIITQYVGFINHWVTTGKDKPLSLPPERWQELENVISDAATTLEFIEKEKQNLERLRLHYQQAKVEIPADLEALQKTVQEAQTKYGRSLGTFQNRLMGLLKNPALSQSQFMTYRALIERICAEHGWNPPVYMMDY